MSVAHFDHVGPWTFDDLETLPDDGWRYEVVDGALLMTLVIDVDALSNL